MYVYIFTHMSKHLPESVDTITYLLTYMDLHFTWIMYLEIP